jgi:dihydrofolate reductase
MNRNASMWIPGVVHAGGEFVGTLIEADLIDEFHLIIHPVVLGSGKRLSPTVLRRSLRSPTQESTLTGVTVLTLTPAPRGADPGQASPQ